MSCITTLCQLFKAVALLIHIDNLPVKSTIFLLYFEEKKWPPQKKKKC